MARPDPLDPDTFVSGESESMQPPEISAGPGAVPVGSTVVGVNLDGDGAPVRAAATQNGSFVLTIEHDVGDVLRLWVVSGALRSVPVDVVRRVDGGHFELNAPPPCLTVPIEVAVQVGTTTTLTIANDCADDVPVTGLSARLQQAGLAVSELPAVIPAGDTSELELVVDPGAAVDEILLFEVEVSGSAERYATSVYTP